MFKEKTLEVFVGLFMLAGVLAFLVLSLKVSGLTGYVGGQGYMISAEFDNIGSLKPRAPVTIAGVRIGEVVDIDLDAITFKARVNMHIGSKQSNIPNDSSARILTEGILGSNYISISPGFEEVPRVLKAGSQIQDTHPALILENLIGQLLFNLSSDKKKDN